MSNLTKERIMNDAHKALYKAAMNIVLNYEPIEGSEHYGQISHAHMADLEEAMKLQNPHD